MAGFGAGKFYGVRQEGYIAVMTREEILSILRLGATEQTEVSKSLEASGLPTDLKFLSPSERFSMALSVEGEVYDEEDDVKWEDLDEDRDWAESSEDDGDNVEVQSE